MGGVRGKAAGFHHKNKVSKFFRGQEERSGSEKREIKKREGEKCGRIKVFTIFSFFSSPLSVPSLTPFFL